MTHGRRGKEEPDRTHKKETLRDPGKKGEVPEDMKKKDNQTLSPKMAVPTRTRVAPSRMAVSKSPLMPMDSSAM